jgi:uncharacterized protein YndB with AHSA1/START domain
MPSVVDHAVSAAPPEEVWKLLYDPARFPEWWAGMARLELGAEPGAFTYWQEGWPDFAFPQKVSANRDRTRVTISCLVSFMNIDWRLSEDGGGTRIDVHATIPDEEAQRCEQVRTLLGESVRRLAEVAATGVPRARG